MKKIIFVIIFIIAQLNPVYAKKEYSSLNIIEQIEKNLMYTKDVKKAAPEAPIVIQRGGWSQDDTEDFELLDEPMGKVEIKSSKEDKRIITMKRKAYDALQIGQIEVAIKIYRQILKKDKNDDYAKLSLATAYHQLGQYRQAKPLYLEMLNKFPGDEQIIANLLAIVIEETPYEAVYLLSALADKNPTSPLIHAQTSMAYVNIKDYPKAIEYLNRAIRFDQNNINYKYNLAVLHDLNDNPSQAVLLYKGVIGYAMNNDIMNLIPHKKIKERIKVLEGQ